MTNIQRTLTLAIVGVLGLVALVLIAILAIRRVDIPAILNTAATASLAILGTAWHSTPNDPPAPAPLPAPPALPV